jgi:eukaryotic-like serine/threonine-protein kinase
MRLCRLCKRLLPSEQAVCSDDGSSTVEAPIDAISLPEELAARFPDRVPFAVGATGTLFLIDKPGSIEDQLGPQLVLKVLAPQLTADAAERARVRRELRKQQGLIHPQLPRVLDEGEAAGRVWFTREYVPATSLAVRLHTDGALAPEVALHVIVQLAAALDRLHQLGVVHRDLKPGHVLLRSSAAAERISLQLIDATLAAPLSAGDYTRRGSADYAAKEIVEGTVGTFRSDLYALGCLSYELLTGAPPFRDASRAGSGSEADTAATLEAQCNAEPRPLPAAVPQAMRSVITSMLSKDARRRPFSAQQVRRSVEPLLVPAKPAARGGSASALQREAAALRLIGMAAKPPTPAKFPDATVELDVKDLDEAIQDNDEQERRVARERAASAKASSSVDDSAPTIALDPSLLAPPVAADSQVHLAHAPDKSATLANAQPATESVSLSATVSDGPDLAALTTPGAIDLSSTQPGVGSALDVEALEAAVSAQQAAAAAPSSDSAVAPDAATTAAVDDMPPRRRTGTKFGLGPVRTADIEAAAALAAQLPLSETPAERTPHESAVRSSYPPVHEPAASSAPQPPAANKPSARPKRYSSSPKALAESPSLLLWAAGGLVVLIVALRLLFGPAERTRSPAIVVQVPEVATELPTRAQAIEEVMSEVSLIGGNLPSGKYVPPRAAGGRAARPETAVAEQAAPPAAATPEAQVEASDDDDDEVVAGDTKRVPTVSASSVKGGLARAASNRQNAVTGLPENESASPDFKAKGRELYKVGKYREAADAYQRATQHNAGDAAAFAGLGGSLLATGDIRKAITAYQKAVRLEPEVSGFQAALGRAYLKKGDRTRARAAYSKALQLDPDNQAARTGMASAKAR